MDDKAFCERRRITITEVSHETGISRATLTRIANIPGYNVSLDVVEQLCRYLNCSPAELLEIIDEQ